MTMKSLASTFVHLFFLNLSSVQSAPQSVPTAPVYPATGHSDDNGGIFGIGLDILTSGFISLDKIPGTLGLGSEFPPLSQLIPGVADILTTNAAPGGSGPYPARWFADPDLPNHTVYAPANPPPGLTMPAIVWGNGFCLNIGTSYLPFLLEIASHGYLIIASGPPLRELPVQNPITLQSKSIQLTQAIDFITSNRATKYGSIDSSRLAAAGQSCGGQEAYSASYHDPRVKLSLLFNSGVFIPARRYLLHELTSPVAYFVGGPIDLGYEVSLADYGALPPTLPALRASIDTGHLGTYFAENGGKIAQAAVAFLEWFFRGDEGARARFTSPDGFVSEGWNVTWKNGIV